MRRYSSSITRISKWAGLISAFAVLVPMLMTIYEVISRGVFNSPSFFTVEIGGYLLVFIIFIPMADVLAKDEYPRMVLLWSRFRPKTRARLDLVLYSISLIALLVLFLLTIKLVLDTYDSGRVSIVLRLPLWPFMAIMPLGLGLLALQLVAKLYESFSSARTTGVKEPIHKDQS